MVNRVDGTAGFQIGSRRRGADPWPRLGLLSTVFTLNQMHE